MERSSLAATWNWLQNASNALSINQSANREMSRFHSGLYLHASYSAMQPWCWLITRPILFNLFSLLPILQREPEAHESEGYDNYLSLLRDVFQKCHAVLSEGRFMVVNTSPVLIRRPHRGASSRRIPITFDIHAILTRSVLSS